MKIATFFLSLVSLPALAATSWLDVNQLNQTLQQTNAGWTAKSNHLSELDENTIRGMLGAHRDTADVRFRMNRANLRTTLPTVVDWRNRNGNVWVTPILDQGFCGSCVAFASIASLETQYRIATGFAGFNVRLSPQYAFSCGGGSCGMGWQPEDAAQFLASTGTPDEACMPYTAGQNDQDVACSAACSDVSHRVTKISAFTRPTRMEWDIDSLKQALQNGPVVTTLNVYADFMAYSSGVYRHVTGKFLGGHAASIVGYDDTQQALIVRNSWGTDWGQNGFAYVSYDDISEVGDDTWSYQIAPIGGAVTVESPVDYSYFTQAASVKVNSTFSNTDSLAVSFFDASGHAVYLGNCQGSTCSLSAGVGALNDGRYTVQAYAMDSTGQRLGSSQVQAFYVSNTQPTISLSFSGAQGADLSRPLTGTVAVQLSVSTSNNVPLSSVVFHYAGNGWNVSRAATAVANGMMMDWGTAKLPNGTYEVWFDGHLDTNGFHGLYTTPHLTVTTQN